MARLSGPAVSGPVLPWRPVNRLIFNISSGYINRRLAGQAHLCLSSVKFTNEMWGVFCMIVNCIFLSSGIVTGNFTQSVKSLVQHA